jgi:hypothetical protein
LCCVQGLFGWNYSSMHVQDKGRGRRSGDELERKKNAVWIGFNASHCSFSIYMRLRLFFLSWQAVPKASYITLSPLPFRTLKLLWDFHYISGFLRASDRLKRYSLRPRKHAILAQYHGLVSQVQLIIDKKISIFMISNKSN